MTDDPPKLADCPLTWSWARAADAPAEIRREVSALAQREPVRFRSLARTSEARIDVFAGATGKSLFVNDVLVAREPSTPEAKE